MSRGSLITLLVLLLLIGGAVALSMTLSERSVRAPGRVASSTPDLTGQAIFSDSEYGFTIRYPEKYGIEYTFKPYYHVPGSWSMIALPDATGTPIVAIVGYRTESTTTYPVYFDTEVRVGVSRDPKEVARCTTIASTTDVSIGGVAFKAVPFHEAGMSQYADGTSYRTLHDGACFALERFKTGAQHMDAPSPQDIPDTTLNADYDALDAVVKSFSFVGS